MEQNVEEAILFLQVFENLQGFVDQFLPARRGYLVAVRRGAVAFVCKIEGYSAICSP